MNKGKVDVLLGLHIHLDGSLPPETIVKLAELSGYRLPADSPEALRPYLTVGAAVCFGIPWHPNRRIFS